MSTAPMPFSSPVEYPTATVGGREYQLRYSKTAQYLLDKWGFEISPTVKIPALAWAAAMVGHVDPSGTWKSAGFKSEVDFVDTIGVNENLDALYLAVTEALKKVLGSATVTLTAGPADQEPSGVN